MPDWLIVIQDTRGSDEREGFSAGEHRGTEGLTCGPLGLRLAHTVPGEWRESAAGSQTQYEWRMNPEFRDDEAQQLAQGLTEFLLEDWFSHWLRSLIRRHYPYFEFDEQSALLAYAATRLTANRGAIEARTALVKHRIEDFLADHHHVVVEGLATFLLKDVGREMEDAIDLAVDDLLMENEQREFVRLLRNFLSLQSPRVGEVHVFYRGSRFFIEDGDGHPAGLDIVQELMAGLPSEAPQDDLLLSALLTLAPRRIHLHRGPTEEDAKRTLAQVFEERLDICHGCAASRCRRQRLPRVD